MTNNPDIALTTKNRVRELIARIMNKAGTAIQIFDEAPLEAFNLCADIELAVVEIMDLWEDKED